MTVMVKVAFDTSMVSRPTRRGSGPRAVVVPSSGTCHEYERVARDHRDLLPRVGGRAAVLVCASRDVGRGQVIACVEPAAHVSPPFGDDTVSAWVVLGAYR